jgi:hypothetical protein
MHGSENHSYKLIKNVILEQDQTNVLKTFVLAFFNGLKLTKFSFSKKNKPSLIVQKTP